MIMGPGFEDSEFRVPYDRLQDAGHQVTLLGTESGQTLEGKQGNESARVEATPKQRKPDEFDAVVIPGGHAPDSIRTDTDIVAFVRDFASSGKPIAAVCHGPQLLIEADVVKGKTMTSWPSVRTDLENAGANWVDEEVVQDGNFITSRKPDDLDAFTGVLLSAL